MQKEKRRTFTARSCIRGKIANPTFPTVFSVRLETVVEFVEPDVEKKNPNSFTNIKNLKIRH